MKVFITGITGTLGTAIAKLHTARGDEVSGCSRNEERASRWIAENPDVDLSIADAVEAVDQLSRVGVQIRKADVCYHCAAMKHVDLCEANPMEAVKQNVTLTSVLAYVCAAVGVQFRFISSDKACLPQGVYGASKLIGERIVLGAGGGVFRLGNLIGSSGSVFQKWRELVKAGKSITVTDPEMTRYFISVDAAAEYVTTLSPIGRVFVPVMKSACMGDIARALTGSIEVSGPRPGETKYQWISEPGRAAWPTVDHKSFVLDRGDVLGGGLCSVDAKRWDTQELLEVAQCVQS